jgi:hypothetical protein
MHKPQISRRIVLLVLAYTLTATPAYAYIDPNAQNIIAQSLTPLLVVAATVGMFFRDKAVSAMHWLGRCFGRRADGETE